MFLSASLLSRACAAGLLFFVAVFGLHAQPVDPLPSWNAGISKARIVAFVQAVTEPGGKDFVPPAERIAVAPLGSGVVDPTPGSTLVTGYFTGQDLKNLLEFLLIDNAAHPGECFPRASGMRFRYDLARPKFDVVTAIELGDLDRGYKPIDISGKDERL